MVSPHRARTKGNLYLKINQMTVNTSKGHFSRYFMLLCPNFSVCKINVYNVRNRNARSGNLDVTPLTNISLYLSDVQDFRSVDESQPLVV